MYENTYNRTVKGWSGTPFSIKVAMVALVILTAVVGVSEVAHLKAGAEQTAQNVGSTFIENITANFNGINR